MTSHWKYPINKESRGDQFWKRREVNVSPILEERGAPSRRSYSPPAITASFEQRRTIHGAIRRFQELLRFEGSVLKQRIRDSVLSTAPLSFFSPTSLFSNQSPLFRVSSRPDAPHVCSKSTQWNFRETFTTYWTRSCSLPNNEVNLPTDQRIRRVFLASQRRRFHSVCSHVGIQLLKRLS